MHMYHKSRYRARKKYYEKEENKEHKRVYQRAYEKRPEVMARKRKKWGGKREKTLIYAHHEQWATDNGYRDNDTLNGKNSDRFINYEVE